MNTRRRWFDRTFTLGLPSSALPDVLERLRGTPLRLAERTSRLTPEALTAKPRAAWSIQEHAGHLLDLEDLWTGRTDDLLNGEEILREADLTNRRTHEANHNASALEDLLAAFRDTRLRWVQRLESLTSDHLTRTALHPRLRQPMSVVDLCFFVAEHDDHHLADITGLRP